MSPAFTRLLHALHTPETLFRLTAAEWDGLIRHARQAGLLSRLALDARRCGDFAALPEIARRHMEAAERVAERQHRAVRWEVHKLGQALEPVSTPIILLKGAAYVMAGLPPARGRLIGDIDIMLPKDCLAQAETLLKYGGWSSSLNDPYDQRYYREASHELPPMTHFRRGSTLDVHHNILPPTCRCKPQAALLWPEAVILEGRIARLGDADLLIHAATHLYHEGEWGYCLRNLVDIDALLRHFGVNDEFWRALPPRATVLDLAFPLAYALTHAASLLKTPVPAQTLDWAEAVIGVRRHVMHPLFRQGFAAAHPDLSGPWGALAHFALYVRSHGLRLPLHQLIPHLLQRSLRRRHE